MSGLQQLGGVPAGGVAVGADHHTLAGGQSVILDDPRPLACGRPEPVQGGVEMGGIVDGLTGCGAHPGGGHHVFGEGLGSLDAGGVRRRAEAGDPGRPYRVGHAANQGHLGADHHQVGVIRVARAVTSSGEVTSTSYWAATGRSPRCRAR